MIYDIVRYNMIQMLTTTLYMYIFKTAIKMNDI